MNPYEPPQTDLRTQIKPVAARPLAEKSFVFRFGMNLLLAVVVCFGLCCLADYVYVHFYELIDVVGTVVVILAVAISFMLGMAVAKDTSTGKRFALGSLMIAINFVVQLLLGMSLGLAFHFAIGGTQ